MKLKKKKQDVGLSTTTMVDVLFILLIFFILSSTIKKDNIDIKAAKVKKTDQPQTQKKTQKEIAMTIDGNNKSYLNGNIIKSQEELRAELNKIKANTPKDTKIVVIFRTDSNSKNGKATEVLGVLSECQLIENLQWEVEGESATTN